MALRVDGNRSDHLLYYVNNQTDVDDANESDKGKEKYWAESSLSSDKAHICEEEHFECVLGFGRVEKLCGM
jgi:hypothetical protein